MFQEMYRFSIEIPVGIDIIENKDMTTTLSSDTPIKHPPDAALNYRNMNL